MRGLLLVVVLVYINLFQFDCETGTFGALDETRIYFTTDQPWAFDTILIYLYMCVILVSVNISE